jgi:hypothetical protein
VPSSGGVPVKTLAGVAGRPAEPPKLGVPNRGLNMQRPDEAPYVGSPSGRNIMEFCRAKPVYTCQSMSVERIKKRLPSGASTENPLPRPSTTSTVRWVWLQ